MRELEMNVNISKSWGYSESMHMIPWIKVGLTPVFQWMVIPLVMILLVRHHFLLYSRRYNYPSKGLP